MEQRPTTPSRLKLNHFAIPYLAILAFMFGGILNSGGIDWYATLAVPAWNPSNQVIALMWALIYVCATASLLMVWNRTAHDNRFRTIVLGYGAVTLLNFLWSVLFFELHQFAWSVAASSLLALFIAILMKLIYPRSRTAALFLLPYLAWVLFATFLLAAVATLNT